MSKFFFKTVNLTYDAYTFFIYETVYIIAYDLEFTPIVLDCCGIIHSDAWKLLKSNSHLVTLTPNQTSKPYSQCI